MTTRAMGGLNSSEEREGQQMVPAHGRKQMHGPDRRSLQLCFQSMLPDSFFTKRKVEGQRGAPIHVKLIDTSTGHVVRSGPESCVKLKVVVVEGNFNNEEDDDWTQEDFESRIVKEREGKSPLLIGKLHVHLREGVGALGNLSFTDNSSWTRSKKFRLGVEIASGLREGIRVREAITNPFVVKDCRGEVYEKRELPALDDEVWRLKQIRQKGPFHKRLNDNGIFIVEDFLWLLGTDPEGLRKILGSSMRDKMWDALVQHAKTCDLRGKHYVYYADNTKNFGVVFKSICELSGYILDGKYYSAETLPDSQKVLADTLKKEAYAKWKDIVEYDGLLPLEMNPSERAPSSQTDVVAPESYPSDTDQRVSPAFLTHVAPQPGLVNPGPAVGDDFCNHTVAGGLHGFFNHTVEGGSWSSVLSKDYEYGSSTFFSSIGDMVSIPRGKYHVYYADSAKNSGVVLKITSKLCGLIEGGEYNSAETLSDSQKVTADTLKKVAGDNWKDIVEYDGLLPLEMNPSKRARSSQTDVVAPESCPSDIDQRVSRAFLTHVAPLEPVLVNLGPAFGGEASENSMPAFIDVDLVDLSSGKADGNTELSVGSEYFLLHYYVLNINEVGGINEMLINVSFQLINLNCPGAGLDAFCREVNLSHLPELPLDPLELADGNTVFSVGGDYFLLHYYVLNINQVRGINEILIKVISFRIILLSSKLWSFL